MCSVDQETGNAILNIDTTAANADYVEQIGDIVSAYVSNNHVAPADVPALIASVHAAISALSGGGASIATKDDAAEKPTAAQIRKSIRPDGLISFIDGKSYKTLKRHLTKHGLDPYSYRERFGLPVDYPLVCSSYSEKRSSLAKSAGLGRLNAEQAAAETAVKGRKKAA